MRYKRQFNCIFLTLCILLGSLCQVEKTCDLLTKVGLLCTGLQHNGYISGIEIPDSEDALTEPYTERGVIEKPEDSFPQNSLKQNRPPVGILSVTAFNLLRIIPCFTGLIIGAGGPDIRPS